MIDISNICLQGRKGLSLGLQRGNLCMKGRQWLWGYEKLHFFGFIFAHIDFTFRVRLKSSVNQFTVLHKN